ncbi:MAG: ABC transporter permease [Myxococcota bacterium]|nr:ABC transporter permease [Myxococcota bacterium]MDW8362929.1 ABC transporter permease [Myxococcales bacterium]
MSPTGSDAPFASQADAHGAARPLETLGAALLDIAIQLGGVGLLAARAARRLLPPRLDALELGRQLDRMTSGSLAVVVATALFTGAIMVVQAAPMVQRFEARELVGWGAGFATLREVGPLLIALVFNGRVGAFVAAELGTMTVTDQVDALRALAIDPLEHLVLPRLLAMLVAIVALTVIGDLVAITGAVATSWLLLDVDPRAFVHSMTELLGPADFLVGCVKSAVFGVLIGLCSCHFGLTVRGGAPGVGRAVHSSVVASAAGIFVLDYVSTFVLE